MALNRAVENQTMVAGCRVLHSAATGSAQPQGFVHRLLGKIKITEQADQSCQDSSRIHAIKGVEQFAYLLGGTLGHDDDLSKPATPNQFGKRRFDANCPGRDSEIWTTERFPRLTQTSSMHSFELRTSSTTTALSRAPLDRDPKRSRSPLRSFPPPDPLDRR